MKKNVAGQGMDRDREGRRAVGAESCRLHVPAIMGTLNGQKLLFQKALLDTMRTAPRTRIVTIPLQMGGESWKGVGGRGSASQDTWQPFQGMRSPFQAVSCGEEGWRWARS